MPLGLGFFATAGAGAGAGDFRLIQTAFGTGSANTITFSSIPSSFRHLQIRWSAIAVSGSLFCSFNGDTSSIKPYHNLVGTGSSVSSQGFTNQVELPLQAINNTTTSWINTGVMDLIDYANTSKNKTIRWFRGDTNAHVGFDAGLWISTSAITSITFRSSGGNFTTATRFSLYGLS